MQKVCDCDSDSDCANDGFVCGEDCKCEAKPASCNCSGDGECGVASKCIDCNCEECPKGPYLYDVRNIFGYLDPLPLYTVTNQLILFLSSAFWGPPPLRTSYMEAP